MSDINSPMNACMYKDNCLETIRTHQAEIDRLKGQWDRLLNVDRLAEIIRKVDGNHNLGAGRLAEMIIAGIEAEDD